MLIRTQYFIKRASRIVSKAKVSLGLIKLRSVFVKGEASKRKLTCKCLHKELCTDNIRNLLGKNCINHYKVEKKVGLVDNI